MAKERDSAVNHLKWVSFWVTHCADQADAKMRHVNRCIGKLRTNGYLADAVILGPVIHHRYYAPTPGGSDSGQLIQAGLSVADGIGVVLWDTEEFAAWADFPEELEFHALNRLQSYQHCEPALRALLLPHIEPLLMTLLKLMP